MKRQLLKSLLLHLGARIVLLVAAVATATGQGGLWPFDLRYSVMVTGAGLAILGLGWGLWWLVPVALAAVTRSLVWRVALWPLVVLGFIALHAVIGPARGFAPLSVLTWLGAMSLYAVPVALALVIGSALGALFRSGCNKFNPLRAQVRPASQRQRIEE